MPDAPEYPKSADFHAEQLPYPASQADMTPAPFTDLGNYQAAHKLAGKVALITGADSGIGRAVAFAYAMEGADIAILYNERDDDAAVTRAGVEGHGRRCLTIKADVRDSEACRKAVAQTVAELGGLNILVNNAAFQHAVHHFEEITEEQWRRTLETNIFGYFYMAQAALPHLTKGDVIINTGSIVGLIGHPLLVDYGASKGAIHGFTKSLALNLADRGIRVNCIAPGPVWTPSIPATMPPEKVENYGNESPLGRPGQPEELAPAYVFLAASDSSYITGTIVEVTGGVLASSKG